MSNKQKFTYNGLVFTVKLVENGDGCTECPFLGSTNMCYAAPECASTSHFKILRVRDAKETQVHDE